MRRLEPALARDRAKPLRTLVNARERDIITARAKASGLTVSAYLRAAAIGVLLPRASTLELAAADTFAKVNADQARLGNLLKLYLQDSKPDHAAATLLIAEIRAMQAELKAVMREIRT